jgi:Malectin domain
MEPDAKQETRAETGIGFVTAPLIRQICNCGREFPCLLTSPYVIPGKSVDIGVSPLPRPLPSGIQLIRIRVTPIAAMNAGGLAIGSFGNDAFYTGGTASVVTPVIDTTAVTPSVPASIYSSARTGDFSYTIPNLTPGAVYSVRLHFAKTSTSNANQRRFNVSINGTKVLSNFDIVSAAGSLNKALVPRFASVADSSGRIVIQFTGSKAGTGKVSAIEVVR